MIKWQEVFSKDGLPWQDAATLSEPVAVSDLDGLKRFLDAVHIRFCLVKPYQENKNYPLVEGRELLPSFDNDMFEYKDLPGFALVAFARQLDYFSEIFQFDKLHPVITEADGACCPLENQVIDLNIQTLASRLPRIHQDIFRQQFRYVDTVLLDNYPSLMPYLLNMDRAQVLAWDADKFFHLAGVFASFPSDIDSELKRFGIRIGKFVYGDSDMYERNRMFVYQYLMELYGFPIVSERRTSSALFARKLHKMGERFLLRVMGQTDRTLTTYISNGENRRYPMLEKIALVAVDEDQEEALDIIDKDGFFLDKAKRVVIIRITYRQHRFDSSNVRQDRALSVAGQEVLHPLTGEPLRGLNIIKDASNMFLRLNDIVRGEFTGRIVYKRTEVVENTDTDEKRLKFLYTWLSKHQRRMISYSDEFFANVSKVLSGYLFAPENSEVFDNMRDLYQEVCTRFSYIQQARRVRILEDICQRTFKGARITYRQMMREAVDLLNELKFEIVNFFPALVDDIIGCVEKILRDRYLQRNYLDVPESSLTKAGLEIRKNYGRLVSLQDGFKAVRKARLGTEAKVMKEVIVA
ncbi:hypothetical protein [Desulfovibrio fairfieldensis]|uniref:Uncharacterized protein n=1 Tax=Desulfovibrio fairfieldensis TaxID=44742 RepID=A0A0X8JJF9_9BACT|nr:hypothetical protein [Desulfovibrio fairfieldensis]AMD89777.1 hypothetical protein AXF13_06440 [Desulfovibrio fairfieldensis]GKG92410.1 hypothetical protein CE91St38_04180 [Desulfovibrionaceae bacterium]GKI10961.1 hypothetical protein CE91St39_04150 [Desulfovibrionaceae bacterium]